MKGRGRDQLDGERRAFSGAMSTIEKE